jgi:hypothetical protein
MSTLQTVSLFSAERKDLETILWNQMKRLPASPQLSHFAVYTVQCSLEDDRAMQYLIEEIREEGSSRASRKGKVLMALLSPEFDQWKKEYDTCGIVRISSANLEACEYLDILRLKWKAIDPPIEEQPHEA